MNFEYEKLFKEVAPPWLPSEWPIRPFMVLWTIGLIVLAVFSTPSWLWGVGLFWGTWFLLRVFLREGVRLGLMEAEIHLREEEIRKIESRLQTYRTNQASRN